MSKEAVEEFDCFGSRCSALVIGSGEAGSAREASALARDKLLSWHERFSRFLPYSELSLLNRDPRREVPVSPLMARFAEAVCNAGELTGGLVDATLLGDIESAGYSGKLPASVPLARALALAPERAPAGASAREGWRELQVDLDTNTVTRPPGLKLDSGGLAKGLFADLLGEMLAEHPSFAINCAGDLTIGGSAQFTRPINVQSPFDGRTLHTFHLSHTGVATSGIGRRSWFTANGKPAHHLLDPRNGRPAFTGVVQVTALAPSALIAEIRAKAAILSGPSVAASWLPDGGVIVFDDGSHQVMEPATVVTLSQLSAFLQGPRKRALQDA
ncbi:MAG TPA: FAD:protein FMN transferase [Solirubrobacteraceae bacterium]